METISIIMAVVSIIAAVLQIILFFKVWGMCNDVDRIRRSIIVKDDSVAQTKEDDTSASWERNIAICSILIFIIVITLIIVYTI